MKISSLERIEKIKVDMKGSKDVFKQVPTSKKDGAPPFSLRVFTLEPNGYTPFHRHPFEFLNYIIEGKGSLVIESGMDHEVKKGDFILVVPDEKHQYRNKSSKEPFIIICAMLKEYE
jgi:quercetin dioxygenase-like cupin family protein